MYKYGEEISFSFILLKVEDYEDLQPFTCGNQKLDNHMHNDKYRITKLLITMVCISFLETKTQIR